MHAFRQRAQPDFTIPHQVPVDITATGLPDAAFDGAMSVVMLWYVVDKEAALREFVQLLKSGARFAFTNWDRNRMPPPDLRAVGDHRPLLEAAGFAFCACGHFLPGSSSAHTCWPICRYV
jgi:SAM-dependent methyltransferase